MAKTSQVTLIAFGVAVILTISIVLITTLQSSVTDTNSRDAAVVGKKRTGPSSILGSTLNVVSSHKPPSPSPTLVSLLTTLSKNANSAVTSGTNASPTDSSGASVKASSLPLTGRTETLAGDSSLPTSVDPSAGSPKSSVSAVPSGNAASSPSQDSTKSISTVPPTSSSAFGATSSSISPNSGSTNGGSSANSSLELSTSVLPVFTEPTTQESTVQTTSLERLTTTFEATTTFIGTSTEAIPTTTPTPKCSIIDFCGTTSSSPKLTATFPNGIKPGAIGVDENNVYITGNIDNSMNKIVQIENGLRTIWDVSSNQLTGVAEYEGIIYISVSNGDSSKVMMATVNRNYLGDLRGFSFKSPAQIHIYDKHVYVADVTQGIGVFNFDGSYNKTIGQTGTADQLSGPIAFAFNSKGTMIVGSKDNKEITVFANPKVLISGFSTGNFRQIMTDEADNIYVAHANEIIVYSAHDNKLVCRLNMNSPVGGAALDKSCRLHVTMENLSSTYTFTKT